MDFPLFYCNGCSYSDENYRPEMKEHVYINQVQRYVGKGFVLNKAIYGSNNKRILRTSLHDLYHQRQINKSQKIIALIQLTFELRGEIWYPKLQKRDWWSPEESEFITHQFSGRSDWKERLLNFLDIGESDNFVNSDTDQKFLNDYSKGRAFFYSPYQERINLVSELTMFANTLEKLNIEFLIFQGPKAEKLENEYLLDFFKSLLPTDNIFDLEEFGFCDWCADQNFLTLDKSELTEIGHYGPDAHKAFADDIIIPHLTKLKII